MAQDHAADPTPAPAPAGLTLAEIQRHISGRYEKADRERGTPGTFLWFIEEVGELATALHGTDRANLEEEFADIRRQHGAPGTDPAASGGVRPVFRHEQTADGVVFTIYSGDKVATRMIAHLEPLDGGRRTRIWAEVERGDAPDEQVSPAFRSTGVTLGLFSAALVGCRAEGEVDVVSTIVPGR